MEVSLSEQVWVDYKPANFGSRALAYFLDWLLRVVLYLCIALALIISSLLAHEAASWIQALEGIFKSATIDKFLGLFIGLLLVVELGYPIYFEVARNGQSPGKKIMGLRVVNRQGLPISIRAAIIRALFIPLDILPSTGFVALLSMLFTKDSQRLGDIAASTLVIYDAEQWQPSPGTSVPWDAEKVTILPAPVYRVFSDYLTRHSSLAPEAQHKAQVVICKLLAKENISLSPELKSQDFVPKLRIIVKNSEPSRRKFTPSETISSLSWKDVHQRLEEGHRILLQSSEQKRQLSPENIMALSQQYQALCQLYGYLSTFYPESREAMVAAQLVRQGRLLIFGRRLERWKERRDPLSSRLAQQFSAIRGYVMLSASVLFFSAIIGWLVVLINPNLAWHFFNEEMAEQLSQGKIWTDSLLGNEFSSAASIATNNIRITFQVFALGITFGIGSIAMLAFNGFHIGSLFAAVERYQLSQRLGEFILAHGFLELSIIVVAGGCGLALGDALLRPKELSRLRSLSLRTQGMVDVILVGALWLLIAGTVEGYISPSPLVSAQRKLVLGILLCLSFWLSMITGRILPLHRRRNS